MERTFSSQLMSTTENEFGVRARLLYVRSGLKKILLLLALVRKLDHLSLKVMIKTIKVAAEVLLN